MEALRGQLGGLVCAAAVGMVNTTIAQANDGHYQAMKYLFEMVGLYPATAIPDTPREDPLAGLLLTRLGIRGESVAGGDERIT